MLKVAPNPPSVTHDRFCCSGIVVQTRQEDLVGLRNRLEEIEGLRLHQEDQASGRLIVTLERQSDQEQADGLRRIQGLAGVLSAAFVYYHRDEGIDGAQSTKEED